uniref:Uncharacterized protein n=1 Tax=Clandestinovirus TaxID=2831644 RepID=A0A8F8KRT8_9VIRU|nr:hypothetical protein KOM_12_544 [Clandestinovirus]
MTLKDLDNGMKVACICAWVKYWQRNVPPIANGGCIWDLVVLVRPDGTRENLGTLAKRNAERLQLIAIEQAERQREKDAKYDYSDEESDEDY